MLRNFFTAFFLLAASFTCFSQIKLGEVACVYVTTTNLDSSVALYEKIGFPKIASNVFPVPWAQVSDGSLLIMMRKDSTQYAGLTYYTTDAEKVVEQLETVKEPAGVSESLIVRQTANVESSFKVVGNLLTITGG